MILFDPDTVDSVIAANLIVIAVFLGMRLLYGYWPWRLHPTLQRQREKVVRQLAAVETGFQPITASPLLGVANENGGAFVRQTGGEPEATSPPKGTNRNEETA